MCHDRPMAVRAAPAVPERQGRRVGRARRTTLFRRLFLTYVAVVGLAVAGLVLAPVTVSVPTALAELAVILGGFAVTLVLFHAFLRRALAPLETLTEVMHQIDPLAPGQRIDTATRDEEVVALAAAINAMLDRLEHAVQSDSSARCKEREAVQPNSHATTHVKCEEQGHKSEGDDHHSDELTEMHRRP